MKLAKYIFAGAMLLTAPAMADELKMATIAPGTTTYRTTATFATIINQNQDDFSIILDATGAAPKHMMELAQGKLDIAVSSPVMFDFMKNQKGMFEKISSAPELSNNLRLLMWFPYGQNHIVVSADSDIKTLEDFAGCASDDLVGWRERKEGETVMHDGVFTPFGTSRAEAEEMVVAARLAVGWITEEDLRAGEEEPEEGEDAEEAPAEPAGVIFDA